MPKFNVSYARIEHQVYSFDVTAESETDAKDKAIKILWNPSFDWNDYDVVHAEEFFVEVKQQRELSRVSL